MKAFEGLAANPTSKLVVVPMEASALAGGITGAMELLRVAAAADGGPRGDARRPRRATDAAPRPPSPPPPRAAARVQQPAGVGPWNQG